MERHAADIANSEIVIFTDGQETTSPHIADIRDEVIKKGIIVHSIIYTLAADPGNHELTKLAHETGGKKVFITSGNQDEILKKFQSVFKCDGRRDTICTRTPKV